MGRSGWMTMGTIATLQPSSYVAVGQATWGLDMCNHADAKARA
jgi:hypothetical protein